MTAAELPTLFSVRAPMRVLILGTDAPMQQAAHLIESLVKGRYYPLRIESDGATIAQGFIELTPTGHHLHLHLRNHLGTVVIALTAGAGADACWALGKFLQAASQ